MRRKDKHIIDGGLIGFALFSLSNVFLQWFEHKIEGKRLNIESFDGKRALEAGAWGGVAGAATGYLTYCYKVEEESKLPFSSNSYLKKLLNEENLKADPESYTQIVKLKKEIEECLYCSFKENLVAPPEIVGSFPKKTANKSKFDLDFILPFQRDSYSTLREMYDDVFNTIGEKFKGIAYVSKQSKSISLELNVNGESFYSDIVPGREIGDYKFDKKLNLYVNPKWSWQDGSMTKTDINVQRNITVNNPEARTAIRLTKNYLNSNSLKLNSPIIEQHIIDALSSKNYGTSHSITENFLNSLEYISKKLPHENFIDLANSNNNLHSKVARADRNYIASFIKRDIDRIEKNPHYIKEIFET